MIRVSIVIKIAAFDRSGYFSLKQIGRTSACDVRARVRAKVAGFSASNKSIWFDARDICKFIQSLRELDRTREGRITLKSMSPQECILAFQNADSLGHIELQIEIARVIYRFGRTEWLKGQVMLEIDPTRFSRYIDELEAELS